jgi:hypothetical protein
MILLRFLKLFGIDVPAHISRLQARFEQRVEVAKDQVRQEVQRAVLVGVLAGVAAVAALSAAGVALFALYRWVLLNYGQFYGLEAVDGVLILVAILLSAVAFLEARSWSAEGVVDQEGQRLGRDAAEAQARPTAWRRQPTRLHGRSRLPTRTPYRHLRIRRPTWWAHCRLSCRA